MHVVSRTSTDLINLPNFSTKNVSFLFIQISCPLNVNRSEGIKRKLRSVLAESVVLVVLLYFVEGRAGDFENQTKQQFNWGKLVREDQ